MLKRSLLLSLFLAAGSVQAEQQAPDLEKGKATAEGICAGCHNPDGNSQLSANPKLAGQIPEYLAKQLHEFQSTDGKPPVRVNAVMNGMAAALTPEDIVNVSHYFGSQTLQPAVAKNGATVEWGQKLWRAGDASKGLPACAACHGPAGKGLPVQFPRLSGQFVEYTVAQLKAFRAEERTNDPNKMMRMIALKMTDKEIEAVADYIAGLR
ncbi:c-type cytochrome [Denitromonas iodatirespirans]|uniref:C-type cytochrome n=1 Tax=Denitromonas iodatirespirans TaxID=2795389 RepID=A0A944DD58_DENI1|nr:c-type cytochrome [Denitromonas iodatirespirans]MBT0960558.1 c-type cytochrome [Denitromonas iodatirespirans]